MKSNELITMIACPNVPSARIPEIKASVVMVIAKVFIFLPNVKGHRTGGSPFDAPPCSPLAGGGVAEWSCGSGSCWSEPDPLVVINEKHVPSIEGKKDVRRSIQQSKLVRPAIVVKLGYKLD